MMRNDHHTYVHINYKYYDITYYLYLFIYTTITMIVLHEYHHDDRRSAGIE